MDVSLCNAEPPTPLGHVFEGEAGILIACLLSELLPTFMDILPSTMIRFMNIYPLKIHMFVTCQKESSLCHLNLNIFSQTVADLYM